MEKIQDIAALRRELAEKDRVIRAQQEELNTYFRTTGDAILKLRGDAN